MGGRQRSLFCHQFRERLPVDEFHHQVCDQLVAIVVFAVVEDTRYAVVGESGGVSCFGSESLEEDLRIDEVIAEDLDADPTAEDQVPRLPLRRFRPRRFVGSANIDRPSTVDAE